MAYKYVDGSIKDVNLSEGFDEVLGYVNTATQSWFSRSILIGVFIIVTFGVYRYKNDLLEALAISGFLTFIIALLFWFTNFIDSVTLTISLAIAVLFFGLLWFSKKSD